jgi:hypothetical protein
MNGNLMLDTLCQLNEEGCLKATKDEELFPFFLVTQSDSANLLGAIDGFLGLSPSKTPGFRSFGQHLKQQKLIEVDSLSISNVNKAIEISFGEYNTSAPQVNFTLFVNSTSTKERQTLWGVKFNRLDLDGVSFMPNNTDNYMVFEPTSPGNQIIFKTPLLFEHSRQAIIKYFEGLGFKVTSNGNPLESIKLIIDRECKDIKMDDKKISLKVNATHGVKFHARDFFRSNPNSTCAFNFKITLNDTSNFDSVVMLSNTFYSQMKAFQINFDTKTAAFVGADFGVDDDPPKPKPV